MGEQVRYCLPAHASAAGVARRLVERQCQRWGLQALCEDAVLAVSELVANAVLHAGGARALTISLDPTFLQVAVEDGSSREPVVRPARRDVLADLERTVADGSDADLEDLRAPSWHVGASGSIAAGRGMLIVEAVAEAWGIAHHGSAKQVWFRLRLPPGMGASGACPA